MDKIENKQGRIGASAPKAGHHPGLATGLELQTLLQHRTGPTPGSQVLGPQNTFSRKDKTHSRVHSQIRLTRLHGNLCSPKGPHCFSIFLLRQNSYTIHSFKVYNSVVFSTFTKLYNHHPYLILEYFVTLKKKKKKTHKKKPCTV